ncbi:MAG: guanylate kinase [Chloroflexi bacterium]|nr:guanylate kinase [Chloroflexota bacterium]
MSNSLCPSSQPRGLLIVLSGPSGAGKDSVINRLRDTRMPLQFITTVTTRQRRHNEVDRVHYHFVSQQEFQTMVDNSELLEWARVYDNWYGVPRQAVRESLEKGQDTLVKVDVQGAATIKKIVPEAVFIFLTAPCIDDLGYRLTKRHTETPADYNLRLGMARSEFEKLPLFDYIVFSRWDEIDRAAGDIRAIITAEKCRVNPRQISL